MERVIRSRHSWLALDLRGLWRYRDLLWLTVRRDFVSRYRQTVLGPLWFVLQPLITAVIFTVVFGRSGAAAGGPPPFVFYLGGMLLWGFFSNVLGSAGNTFQANSAVFTKVYFPRLVVPLAMVVSALVPLAIQSAVFLAVYGWARARGAGLHADAAGLLLLPWCVIQTALLGLGVSLLTSAFSAKYRDLQHALPFVVQMGLFVTPVIFPFAELGPAARAVAAVNPLTPLVEAVRRAFFGTGGVDARLWALSLGLTALVLLAGLVAFHRAERTFADTV